MTPSDLDVLAQCPLFAEAAREDLEALAEVAVRRRFDAGKTLFLAGELPERLHVLVRGRVGVLVLSPASGRELALTVEHPHNAVAELPSFGGGRILPTARRSRRPRHSSWSRVRSSACWSVARGSPCCC